jgi:hypothetical protein
MCDLANHSLHLAPSGSCENPCGVLQIHQDDVDPTLLHQGDTAPYQLFVGGYIIASQDGVGADLPDHQVRMLRDDVAIDTVQFLGHVLAPDTTVYNSDLDGRKTVSQFALEAARVTHGRSARADSLGRGRAYRDNGQPAPLTDPAGAVIESHPKVG